MSIDNKPGQPAAQDGTATGRSAEYDDGLTVQDTAHSADPTDTLGKTGSTGPTTSAPSSTSGSTPASAPSSSTSSHTPTSGSRELGDNRDGAGRDRTDAVTADETGKLISADKVVGTAVYDAAGERLGTIDTIMLGKTSGKVAYAVMSFGGFLGIGERYHPLPWNVLTYDEAKGGYNIQHSADDMRSAPNYSREEVDTLDYGSRGGAINDYYGVNVGGIPTGMLSGDTIGSSTGAGGSGMASSGLGTRRD